MSADAARKTLDYYSSLPYRVEVSRDEAGWFAKVIELPGCMTWADSFAELETMIEDAKLGWIEDALEHDDPIPEPQGVDEYDGKLQIRVPKSLHRDIAQRARDEGVSVDRLVATYLAKGVGFAGAVEPGTFASNTSEQTKVRDLVSRDWPQIVNFTIGEYGNLLQDEELTNLASVRIITDSSQLLQSFSDDLTNISSRAVETSKRLVADTKRRRLPPRKLFEMEKSFKELTELFHSLEDYFDRLETFCWQAIDLHKRRFEEQSGEAEYSAVREAESILQLARGRVRQRNASPSDELN